MAFRLSAHNWMRPEPLEVTCKRLHECGFWGIEIMGEPDLYKPFKSTREILKAHKIECWGSVTIMIKCRDLINADYYLRYGSIQYVKDCLTMIHELGGTVLTLVPSEVGKINCMASPEVEWKWALESLKPIADHAINLLTSSIRARKTIKHAATLKASIKPSPAPSVTASTALEAGLFGCSTSASAVTGFSTSG